MSTALEREDLPHYSVEDYRQWSGDWELIHGIPYAMSPAPTKRHQKLNLAIGNQLLSATEHCPECEVLLETDWVLRPDTVLRPDVALVCDDAESRHIAKTPELIFEVLSPSTARRDEGLKRREYEEAGVKYDVLIDPDRLLARVFRHDGRGFEQPAEYRHESVSFEGIHCPVGLSFDALFQRFR